jgi:hypothetical protein
MTGGTLLNVAYGLEVRGLDDPLYIKSEAALNAALKAALPEAFLVVRVFVHRVPQKHDLNFFLEHLPLITSFTHLVPRRRLSSLCTEVGGAFA